MQRSERSGRFLRKMAKRQTHWTVPVGLLFSAKHLFYLVLASGADTSSFAF
jgi:hypothetical protein